MSKFSTIDALIELEATTGLTAPIGAGDLGVVDRFLVLIKTMRDRICPRLEEFSRKLGSDEAAIIALIIDVAGPTLSNQPFVVGSLYRAITVYGIEEFCRKPEGLLEALEQEDTLN
ncbi:MAG: hypothetical protein AAFY84_17365 [Pseudomonadota bacterium]